MQPSLLWGSICGNWFYAVSVNPMIKHFIFIILSTGALTLGLFRPYMPGDYDSFAAGLSTIIQLVTFASLLLVPMGICWWSLDRIRRRQNVPAGHGIAFLKAMWVISVTITAAAAVGALGTHNISIAVVILALAIFLMIRHGAAIKRLRSQPAKILSPMPYYLIFIPLATFLIRFTWLHEAKVRSTDRAIRQSEQFIHDIEAYKKATGHLPMSIESTIDDYRPSVAGISGLRYEVSGTGYNVYFEQFSDRLGTQEIVMYNALGGHEMTTHNQDLLRESPEQIIRGYYEVEVLSDTGWKIFLFD
ncbi:MAG TPA: hypothetical protein VK658_03570 [Chryseolinea sp.]|nr:hypothetical protein [Chryseolinea sp.]